MRFSAFQENIELQKGGARIQINDARFTIKRWGTKESELFLVRLRRELYGAFSGDPEYLPELIAHWLANYAVIGWEGVYSNDNDELFPYSPRAARQVLLDPSNWLKLNMDLFNAAQNYEN